MLISYSKILRTIIFASSYTRLGYPGGERKLVWLYDGSITYFQTADHIVLGVFVLVVLMILFLPYTFPLLLGQWLLDFSDLQTLQWTNKIKPFLDAYCALYKKHTGYQTGFVLLTRCILFLTFAFNATGHANANLIVITSVAAGLLALAWLHAWQTLQEVVQRLCGSFLHSQPVYIVSFWQEYIMWRRLEEAVLSLLILQLVFLL